MMIEDLSIKEISNQLYHEAVVLEANALAEQIKDVCRIAEVVE
jgi:hypothetical protein